MLHGTTDEWMCRWMGSNSRADSENVLVLSFAQRSCRPYLWSQGSTAVSVTLRARGRMIGRSGNMKRRTARLCQMSEPSSGTCRVLD